MKLFKDHEAYHSSQLEQLVNRAYEAQWSAEKRIDWAAATQLPEGLKVDDYADMISQLYYAEVLTIEVCSRLIQEVPDFQAKRFLCTQLADEARHAQAYKTYLDRFGGLRPVDPGLKATFDSGLAWRGNYCALVVALHVILEGEALHQQRKRIDTLPCPVFAQVNSEIIRDESRHAAFGILYMRDKLVELTPADRMQIMNWIQSIWGNWEKANRNRYPDAGAAVLRTSEDDLNRHLADQLLRLKKVGMVA